MNKSISNFFYCFILIFLTADLYAQKTVYIPASFNNSWEADYSNKNGLNGKISSLADLIDTDERWCKDRTYETDNFICFWEEGFGIDPAKMKNPAGSPSTFNLKTIMNQAEKVLVYQQETLNAPYIDGINHNKYKILIMLSYTTTWAAYGSGYDYQCGAIWMNPAALGVGSINNQYLTLNHELFHVMSYLCYVDRPDDTYSAFQDSFNGPFWERCAVHASLTVYPNSTNEFERYMYAPHSHFLNTRKHYSVSFFLENLDATFGYSSMGDLWKNNKKGDHVMITAANTFFDGDNIRLREFVAETAMKNMTWDYPKGSNGIYHKSYLNTITYDTDVNQVNMANVVLKRFRTILRAVDFDKRHFVVYDCLAPQDYGYNAIQIFPETIDEEESNIVAVHFKGHNNNDDTKSGWSYGFVAIQNDGTPRYGEICSDDDGIITFPFETNDKELWLIVAASPKNHSSENNYKWEAGFPKYYRHPYEIRLHNALPLGYNEDYEGVKGDGSPHVNGGGWVASTATVDESAYVGPHAKVLGNAKVSDNARIEDFAVIKGRAEISGNAVIKENALIATTTKVYDNAVVSGCARCFNQTEIYENAFVTDNVITSYTNISGNAILCGNLWQKNSGTISGTTVVGGDSETIGNAAWGGVATSGTYLQYPDLSNNGRSAMDGKGNLSVDDINILKNNWNDLEIRFDILNKSISSLKTNPNYDVNSPYKYFDTETDLYMPSHTELAINSLNKTSSNIIYQNDDYIFLSDYNNENVRLEIYSYNGMNFINDNVVMPFYTGNLSKGIYIIRIYHKEEIYQQKIIKQ